MVNVEGASQCRYAADQKLEHRGNEKLDYLTRRDKTILSLWEVEVS
jgi:hypothetical protein